MKILVVYIALLCGSLNGDSSFFSNQFVGLKKEEIKKIIAESQKTFKLNTSNINTTYNYLKYEDPIQEITVLFFLSDDNICKMVRFISDYSNINDVLNSLNVNYINIDKANWKYSNNGKNYTVHLEESDWYFTVSIQEMK
jgi:hypothetical protein